MTSGATSPAHSSDPKTSTMAQASLKPRQWPPVTEVGIERTCGRRDLPRTWWKNTKYLQPPWTQNTTPSTTASFCAINKAIICQIEKHPRLSKIKFRPKKHQTKARLLRHQSNTSGKSPRTSPNWVMTAGVQPGPCKSNAISCTRGGKQSHPCRKLVRWSALNRSTWSTALSKLPSAVGGGHYLERVHIKWCCQHCPGGAQGRPFRSPRRETKDPAVQIVGVYTWNTSVNFSAVDRTDYSPYYYYYYYYY